MSRMSMQWLKPASSSTRSSQSSPQFPLPLWRSPCKVAAWQLRRAAHRPRRNRGRCVDASLAALLVVLTVALAVEARMAATISDVLHATAQANDLANPGRGAQCAHQTRRATMCAPTKPGGRRRLHAHPPSTTSPSSSSTSSSSTSSLTSVPPLLTTVARPVPRGRFGIETSSGPIWPLWPAFHVPFNGSNCARDDAAPDHAIVDACKTRRWRAPLGD